MLRFGTLCLAAMLVMLVAGMARAQVTEFTYQGSLKDNGSPANANYDFEFALFDALSGGNQLGATIPKNTVLVTNGIFSVKLDFGSVFPGANRYLEIRVKLTGQSTLTPLTPRQLVNSAPYSVKAVNADNAINATSATTATNATQLGGVAANQYVVTGDARLADARAPTAGSADYIQNQNGAPQATSNFSISGTGNASIFNATTQYNLNGTRILSNAGTNNLFAGVNSGQNNTGQGNAFFGTFTGQANTTGTSNAFFGSSAGFSNMSGNGNSFFGTSAGGNNTTGNLNTFIGTFSGFANTTGSNNSYFGTFADSTNGLTNTTAIGFRAFAGQSNSLVLGSINGTNGATADTNVGIGTTTPTERLHVVGNGVFTGSMTVNGALNATLPSGSTSYIQNTISQQAASNFNVSGNGIAGGTLFGNIVSSNTQYNIGGNRVLTVNGGTFNNRNIFAGVNAGEENTTGIGNSFFGKDSGINNTTGTGNSFFGSGAGLDNQSGDNNTMIGSSANVSFGSGALSFATAIGSHAFVTKSNSLVLGSINGTNGATADTNVGIGLTAPNSRLDVVDSAAQIRFGNTITDAGGYLISIADSQAIISGGAKWNGSAFVAKSTSASFLDDRNGNIDFFANSGLTVDSAFTPTQRMTINSSGNVGIGTASTAQRLDVSGNIRIGTGTTGCVEDRDGTLLTGVCSSDLRFKRNITSFGNMMSGFSKLRPVNFYWRADEFADKHFGTKQSYGLIAQEVEQAFPDLVSTDEQGYKAVNYSKLPLLTIQAVNEQQVQIEKQQKQIDRQNAINSRQQTEIDALRTLVCSRNRRAAACRKR